MAKESMKAREVKRQAMVEKYAEKESFIRSWRLRRFTKTSKKCFTGTFT
jgi:hypothetical protein